MVAWRRDRGVTRRPMLQFDPVAFHERRVGDWHDGVRSRERPRDPSGGCSMALGRVEWSPVKNRCRAMIEMGAFLSAAVACHERLPWVEPPRAGMRAERSGIGAERALNLGGGNWPPCPQRRPSRRWQTPTEPIETGFFDTSISLAAH